LCMCARLLRSSAIRRGHHADRILLRKDRVSTTVVVMAKRRHVSPTRYCGTLDERRSKALSAMVVSTRFCSTRSATADDVSRTTPRGEDYARRLLRRLSDSRFHRSCDRARDQRLTMRRADVRSKQGAVELLKGIAGLESACSAAA